MLPKLRVETTQAGVGAPSGQESIGLAPSSPTASDSPIMGVVREGMFAGPQQTGASFDAPEKSPSTTPAAQRKDFLKLKKHPIRVFVLSGCRPF